MRCVNCTRLPPENEEPLKLQQLCAELLGKAQAEGLRVLPHLCGHERREARRHQRMTGIDAKQAFIAQTGQKGREARLGDGGGWQGAGGGVVLDGNDQDVLRAQAALRARTAGGKEQSRAGENESVSAAGPAGKSAL